MEETIMNPMDDPALSPADYAALMLECTDENGILRLPEDHFTDGLEDVDENAERVFEMDWDAERLKKLIETFEALYGEIGKIAESSLSAEYELRDDPRTKAAGEEAAKYLADGILDDAVVFRARRVCALTILHAPEIIIRNESQRLIEALALTRFAKREIYG